MYVGEMLKNMSLGIVDWKGSGGRRVVVDVSCMNEWM